MGIFVTVLKPSAWLGGGKQDILRVGVGNISPCVLPTMFGLWYGLYTILENL